MSRRRNWRRLAPWAANLTAGSLLGLALAAWLATDPHPAPWTTIVAVIAFTGIVTGCMAWDDHLIRQAERRDAARVEAPICLRCGRRIVRTGPKCCDRPLPSNVPIA